MDHGPQPLRWIGMRRVAGLGDAAPVRFAPGSVGNAAALVVSPPHRMLLAGPRVELFFAEPEVLAAAKHLVDGRAVRQVPVQAVTWVHLLFDRHEIVFAEGAPCESLHPGAAAGGPLEAEIRDELAALFPDLDPGPVLSSPVARPCLRR